jgi:hypothetical protein
MVHSASKVRGALLKLDGTSTGYAADKDCRCAEADRALVYPFQYDFPRFGSERVAGLIGSSVRDEAAVNSSHIVSLFARKISGG